jgi:hypothetical protein
MGFLIALAKFALRFFELIGIGFCIVGLGILLGLLVIWVLDWLFLPQLKPVGVILTLAIVGFVVGGKLEQFT